MIAIVKRASFGALILIVGGIVVPRLAFADATQNIVRCALAQACTSTKNTVGGGIQGITAGTAGLNAGVRGLDGSAKADLNDGVLGAVTNGRYGVEGTSANGALGGVRGTATTGFGMQGVSNGNYGVYGQSNSSYGVYGEGNTAGGVIGTSNTFSGTLGISAGSVGAAGLSSTGSGVYGSSTSGFGVEGSTSVTDAGHFTADTTGTGVYATSNTGHGLVVSTGANVAVVVTSNGNGADVTGSYIGLTARSDNYPLAATNASGANLFQVDGSGNVKISGSYLKYAATRTGQEATVYSTQTTTSNFEDIGSAELVNGVASVKFDPAFAASIDLQTTYHVFLTPNGDTRGLYIASKTASGFIVRETQGGRGRLTFDYRIVAPALGHARERMAFVNPQSDGRPKAPLVVVHPRPATRIPVQQLLQKRTIPNL